MTKEKLSMCDGTGKNLVVEIFSGESTIEMIGVGWREGVACISLSVSAVG